MKPEANNDRTQINIAKLGVISAIAVAAIGVIGTVLTAYVSSQTTRQTIVIPIEATQTAEARPTPAVTKTSSVSANVSPTVGVAAPVNLEQQLLGVNIALAGSEQDKAKVRGYIAEPQSAYQLLAASCLQVVGNRRLKQIGYLDVIDKWYTSLVGEQNYVAADGTLNLDRLREAMVKAQNEIYGDNMASFDEILAP